MEDGPMKLRLPPWGRMADLLIALMFLVSGLLKLANPAMFLEDMLGFPFLPYGLSYATALVLPWLELLAATAILLKRMRPGGMLLLAALMAAFIVFLAVARMYGIDANCGCFGDWLVFPSVETHIAFNAVVLGVIWVRLRNTT